MNCLSKNGNGVISKIKCDIHDSKGMKENWEKYQQKDKDGNILQVSQHLTVKSKLIMGMDRPTSHPSAKRII